VDKITELIIPRSTVESIGQQEIGSLMVGFAWRKNVWQQPHKIVQIVLMQIIGFSTIFTALMLPVDRVLYSYYPPLSQQARSLEVFWVDSSITAIVLIGVNRWIYRRGKQLRKLLKLVEQIEHYNQIVMAIDTLETLARLASNCPDRVPDNILEILTKTRHNLLVALQIESHSEQLRRQPDSSELTLRIANNLVLPNLLCRFKY
jgi:hypothetical protein